MKNILFLCTGNSCRSQMAEGWGKHLMGDKFNFYSAGISKHGLNPKAVKVMREAGVDISSQTSNTTGELPKNVSMDYVFTVCSNAHDQCPHFPEGRTIHVGFDDPPQLTKGIMRNGGLDVGSGSDVLGNNNGGENRDRHYEEKALIIYRRVRDEIRVFVEDIEKYMG